MATPPDFTAGQVLEANAHMNKVGAWLIKTQSTGTTQSSVVVADVFSADYENYRIIVSGGVASTALGLNLTFGATVTGYYYAWTGFQYNNTSSTSGVANTTSFAAAGIGSTTLLHMDLTVSNPFTAKNTLINGQYVFADNTTGLMRVYGGHLANTTSYTGFTLTTSTGTVTGGTVYVYGLRD